MSALQQLAQYLVSGVTNGSIYALVALGFVTIFMVTHIINFAQGEFVMLGSMIAITLLQREIPLPLAALLAVVIVAALSAGLYVTSLKTARRPTGVSLLVITIGASIVIRGLALISWGTDPYSLRPFTPGSPLNLAGAIVRLQSLWVLGATILLLVGFYLFVEHTRPGRGMRACSMDPTAAQIFGVNPGRMALLSFVLAGAGAALAGIVITPLSFATYDMGLTMTIKGFSAAIMGGLLNPVVAVLGGFLLGILEAVASGLLPSGYKDAIAVGFLLVILVWRAVRGQSLVFGAAERS